MTFRRPRKRGRFFWVFTRAGSRHHGVMKNDVAVLFSRTADQAQGSVAQVNSTILELLARRGWRVRRFAPEGPASTREALLPLRLAAACAADAGAGRADLAIYDDGGLALRAPSQRWARRTLVLYHGLAYGSGAWMANDAIDLHCANSPYLASVLRSMFAFPDWRSRTCLDSRAMNAVRRRAAAAAVLAGSGATRRFHARWRASRRRTTAP